MAEDNVNKPGGVSITTLEHKEILLGPTQFHPGTHEVYPRMNKIPACLKVLITYGKLSAQKKMIPTKSQRGPIPIYFDILNHVSCESIYIYIWCMIIFMILFATA